MADDATLLPIDWFKGNLDNCGDDKELNNGDVKVKVELIEKHNTKDVIMGSPINQQVDSCLKFFDTWPEQEQNEFMKKCLVRMSHHQHSQIDSYLIPILQRDFISILPSMLTIYILFYIVPVLYFFHHCMRLINLSIVNHVSSTLLHVNNFFHHCFLLLVYCDTSYNTVCVFYFISILNYLLVLVHRKRSRRCGRKDFNLFGCQFIKRS